MYLARLENNPLSYISTPAVDCGSLDPPMNGDVMLTGTTFNEEAEYSCDSGYSLSGSANRRCMSNREWSGNNPICMSKYMYVHVWSET